MTKDALGRNEKGDQLMTRLFQGITTRAYRAVVWLECKFMYRVPVFERVADRMEAAYGFLHVAKIAQDTDAR